MRLAHQPPVAPSEELIAERSVGDGTSATSAEARRPALAPFMTLAFLIACGRVIDDTGKAAFGRPGAP